MTRIPAKRGFAPVRWLFADEPRRCETGIVGGMGECLHCSADQGENGRCREALAIARATTQGD